MSVSRPLKHWTFRVSDGNNFINSSHESMWAVNSKNKTFLKKVKEGDKLWFIKDKVKDDLHFGRIIAVATFVSKTKRDEGILISLTPTSEELGWDEKGGYCDYLINYTDLYNLSECNLFTGQRRGNTVCDYDNVKDKLLINLSTEYDNILKYSKITKCMKPHKHNPTHPNKC